MQILGVHISVMATVGASPVPGRGKFDLTTHGIYFRCIRALKFKPDEISKSSCDFIQYTNTSTVTETLHVHGVIDEEGPGQVYLEFTVPRSSLTVTPLADNCWNITNSLGVLEFNYYNQYAVLCSAVVIINAMACDAASGNYNFYINGTTGRTKMPALT